MVKGRIGNEVVDCPLHVKVRLDFKGEGKSGIFGKRGTDKLAEETRDQKVALLRNVPIQGIQVTDVDLSLEVYLVMDEVSGREIAYAPAMIELKADSLEDLAKFVLRDDFRKIEVLEPEQFLFTRFDLERFLFRVNEEQKQALYLLERRINAR